MVHRSHGTYNFIFKVEKLSYELKLNIEKFHYNIVSLNETIIIENDKISVLSKGQILNFDFAISGVFYLQKVSIYIIAEEFIENKEMAIGNFNGVNVNNKIVAGEVFINSI